MRGRRFLLTTVVGLLLASVTLASGQPQTGIGCWVDRETIYIYGDEAFTFEHGVVAGCGTPDDPYIIEGWRIVAQTADFGISVEQTTRSFIIRNCLVIGASGAAIRLNTLSNAAVENCQLLRAECGILLENASRNRIVGNLISENRRGAVSTLRSWGNIFTANRFVANGRSAADPNAENHWQWCGIGNYWSDYGGEDCDGDGIGDEPYRLVDDPFPLVTTPSMPDIAMQRSASPPCGYDGHPADCGVSVDTPCYVTLPAGDAAAPCAPEIVSANVPACPTTPDCPPAPCAPRVTPCVDQILNCSRTAVRLTADIFPGSPSCAPCSIRWTNERGEVVGTERSIMVTEPGIYTITITGSDGCTISDSVAVFQDIEPPVVRATADGVLTCNVSEVELTARISGGRPPYDIVWTAPGGATLGCKPTVRATAPGTHTVTVTGANGCTTSATVQVPQDVARPTVRASVDGPLTCERTQVRLTTDVSGGRPPYEYAWTKPGVDLIGSTPSIVVSEGGTYTVTVTGANGCSHSTSVNVTEDLDPPSVILTVDGVLTCSVLEVTLSAAISGGRPPYEVLWTMPGRGVVGEGSSMEATEPGPYTATVTGANGCWASASIDVEQDTNPPVVDAGPDQMLTLETREVTLAAEVNGCDASCTIMWEDMFGEIVGASASVVVDRPGVYRVTAVNTANGCRASDEVAVDADTVSEVLLESNIEGLAVFGQLTKDGVPIPGTDFHFRVGEDVPRAGEAEVSSLRLTDTSGRGHDANGAEVNYIIPSNAVVRFTIHKDQFILGKRYYLLHLPTDPEGTAAIAFF